MDDRETQGDLVMVSQRASRNKDSRDAPSWPKVYSGSARILMNFLIYKPLVWIQKGICLNVFPLGWWIVTTDQLINATSVQTAHFDYSTINVCTRSSFW